ARGVDQSRRSISGNVPGTLCERGAAQTLDLAPAVVVEIGPELLGLTSVHGHAQPVLAAQGDSGRVLIAQLLIERDHTGVHRVLGVRGPGRRSSSLEHLSDERLAGALRCLAVEGDVLLAQLRSAGVEAVAATLRQEIIELLIEVGDQLSGIAGDLMEIDPQATVDARTDRRPQVIE